VFSGIVVANDSSLYANIKELFMLLVCFIIKPFPSSAIPLEDLLCEMLYPPVPWMDI